MREYSVLKSNEMPKCWPADVRVDRAIVQINKFAEWEK